MARRPVAVATAALLFLEAVGVALLNMVLGIAVDRQDMSLGGLDPGAMSVSAWVMGAVFGLYLVFCAILLLRGPVRDRAPGRPGRIVLITCAVVHAVLGAFSVGLVGWPAFAFMMVMLGLIVLTLLSFGPDEDSRQGRAAERPGGGTHPAAAT